MLELSARSFREIGEVFSRLANGTSLILKKMKLVIDLIKHLMLYYEMVTFGVVCPKTT